jgi:hypothetical protein
MGNKEWSSFLIVEKEEKSQPFSAISHYSNVHTYMCTLVHAWKSSLHLRAKDMSMHTIHSGLYHL